MIMMEVPPSKMVETTQLSTTARGSGSFGSTGLAHNTTPTNSKDKVDGNTLRRSPRLQLPNKPTTAMAATLEDSPNDSNDMHIPICNVELSCDPFMATETIKFSPRQNDNTQGLILAESPDW